MLPNNLDKCCLGQEGGHDGGEGRGVSEIEEAIGRGEDFFRRE